MVAMRKKEDITMDVWKGAPGGSKHGRGHIRVILGRRVSEDVFR